LPSSSYFDLDINEYWCGKKHIDALKPDEIMLVLTT